MNRLTPYLLIALCCIGLWLIATRNNPPRATVPPARTSSAHATRYPATCFDHNFANDGSARCPHR